VAVKSNGTTAMDFTYSDEALMILYQTLSRKKLDDEVLRQAFKWP
jgi:hypothetical protein